MTNELLTPSRIDTSLLKGAISGYQLIFDNQSVAHSVYSVEVKEELHKPWLCEVVFTSDSLIDPRTLLRESATLVFTPNTARKDSFKRSNASTTKTQYGVITGFKHLTQNQEEHKYTITLEPKLALLDHNKRNAIYQHQSIVAVVEKILREHELTGVDYRLKLQDEYPTKEFIVQWQESDLAFIQRLLADNGIWLRFESHPKHKKSVIILCDNNESAEQIEAAIPHNSPSSLLDGGTFSVWSLGVESHIISGAVLAKDYNYDAAEKELIAHSAVTASQTKNSSAVYGVDYQYGQDFSEVSGDVDEGEWLANIRAQRYETTQYIITGRSNDYRLAVGQHIIIKASPLLSTDLLITSVSGKGDRTQNYELEFTAIAYDLNKPYRPALLPVPIIYTTIPARVTSPDDDTYGYIDTQGRYRVKFLFDLTEWKAGEESVWLRQAKSYSGNKYGIHFPLIDGTEVAVAFSNGHPDRPYIAHAMHNSAHQDVVTTENKHQNILKTAANNLLTMDDKRGNEHIVLTTEYQKTQLNMGHLVHNSGTTDSQPRGEGFELRSDAWGAIRAGKGLYLSTDERSAAEGSQIDLQEAITQLEQALQIAKGLNNVTSIAGSEATDVKTQEAQLLNSYTDLQKSAMLLSAKEGVAVVSPKTVQLSSGDNLTFTAANSIDGSSQQDIRLAASKKVSLFAEEQEFKMIANQGEMRIQAQNNALEIMAQQELEIVSTENTITIAAKKEIILTAGGASIRIANGQIELQAPKAIEHKGSAFPFNGPGSFDYKFKSYDTGNNELHVLRDTQSGTPLANFNYKIKQADGEISYGTTNDKGETLRFNSGAEQRNFKISNDDRET